MPTKFLDKYNNKWITSKTPLYIFSPSKSHHLKMMEFGTAPALGGSLQSIHTYEYPLQCNCSCVSCEAKSSIVGQYNQELFYLGTDYPISIYTPINLISNKYSTSQKSFPTHFFLEHGNHKSPTIELTYHFPPPF